MAPITLGANSTLAMGTPLTRLFCEPQKMMAISSSLEKPQRRASQTLSPMDMASSRPQTSTRTASASGGIRLQSPPTTEALNAEYTTSRMEVWSRPLMRAAWRCRNGDTQGRRPWPRANGSSSCSAMRPMACNGSLLLAVCDSSRPTSSGVSTIPISVEPDALQIAAGMLPRATAVSVTADWTVAGSVHRNSTPK